MSSSRIRADPYGITNGSNGLANVDPLTFFGGHIVIDTTRDYYWFLLGVVVVILIVLHFLSESRTGRAWKASREDPLAAEQMGIPVSRLKIMAFSFGAGIAGLQAASSRPSRPARSRRTSGPRC